MAAIGSSNAPTVVKKALATQKLATLNLPQENILSSLVFSDINNRQARIEEPGHSTYEWIFDNTNAASPGARSSLGWNMAKASSGSLGRLAAGSPL